MNSAELFWADITLKTTYNFLPRVRDVLVRDVLVRDVLVRDVLRGVIDVLCCVYYHFNLYSTSLVSWHSVRILHFFFNLDHL